MSLESILQSVACFEALFRLEYTFSNENLFRLARFYSGGANEAVLLFLFCSLHSARRLDQAYHCSRYSQQFFVDRVKELFASLLYSIQQCLLWRQVLI